MRISCPKSTLPFRVDDVPELEDSETLLLKGQCAYRNHPFSGWRPVQSFLTDQRLILYLRPKIRVAVPLASIRRIFSERQYCLLKMREVICVVYGNAGPGKSAKLWFVANELKRWRMLIYQLSLFEVSAETLKQLALQLDFDGQEILWYLWEKGHASIRELCDLLGSQDPAYVLDVIKAVINPIAVKTFACPILCFERRKVDLRTGEPVFFHWWILGKGNCSAHSRDRLVDIFDEGTHVAVLLEVKGVSESDLKVDIDGCRLTLRSHKIGASLRVDMKLPAEVEPTGHSIRIKNNLLQMRLQKR